MGGIQNGEPFKGNQPAKVGLMHRKDSHFPFENTQERQMRPTDNKDTADALKIIAQRDPKKVQATSVRLNTQRTED